MTKIDRRAFMRTAPVAIMATPMAVMATPSHGMGVTPTPLADLIEAVMSGVVPYRSGSVAVEAGRLRALCEATGVAWGEHWAMRACVGDDNAPCDPHPEWMDQWRAARVRWTELSDIPGNGNWDDPRSLECNRIQDEMERRLSTVPATTIAGAIACLSWLEEEISPDEWPYKGHHKAMLNALAALRGVQGDGAFVSG